MSGIDAPGQAMLRNRVGHFALAAPCAQQALAELHERLLDWQHNPGVLAVVLRCSATAESVAEREMVPLGELLADYGKPVLALLDGTLRGSLLQLLQGSTLRTVSERSALYLDETALRADQPLAAALLARLPVELARYLCLTGRPLRPADALYAGLADFCLPSEMVAEFDRCLDGMSWSNHPREALRTLLATLATRRMPGAELKALRLAIDEHFGAPSLEAIRASLAREARPAYQDWADETLALLDRRSMAPAQPQRRRTATSGTAGAFQASAGRP